MLSFTELEKLFPKGGLYGDGERGKRWLFSPEPLKISKKEAKTVSRLGRGLDRFQAACERLYRRSAKGSWEPWLAELVDAGKPSWLIEAQRSHVWADERPRVIRPDLLLRELRGGGLFGISELDAVPGGIGMTAWLSEVYGQAGFEILGGERGMREGFRSLFPESGGRVLISEESGDYKEEMVYLCDGLCGMEVVSAEAEKLEGEEARYRFFELFDWANIPVAQDLAVKGGVTPPMKPLFEEKLWLALLWCPALREVWKAELRGAHLATLQELVPFGWVVDPTELPPHAALPKLGLQSWAEVGQLSQKERRLVLKISGFNERAWGSRGVVVGHDVPGHEWAKAIAGAVDEFPCQPWVVQEFVEGRLVEHPYYDRESGELKTMKGRVRLCPYYFRSLADEEITLGGCLATIVPADKKKIHGMEDAILVPVTVD